MAVLCLLVNTALSQGNAVDLRTAPSPVYIGEWISQDMPFGKVINYKRNTISLAHFKNKMVIMGFWFPSCTPCVAQFPKELALQQKFSNEIQLLLVTYEPEQKIRMFIKDWEQKNGISFTLPLIVEDTLLTKAFRVRYNPHYVWFLPGGKAVAQTEHYMVTEDAIKSMLPAIKEMNTHLEKWKSESVEKQLPNH